MFKQVIVVRKDLKMSPGKLAVQVAHASIESFLKAQRTNPDWCDLWLREGQKKVVVEVPNKDALLMLYEDVKKVLPAALVVDAGRTELEPGTLTCFGIGPVPEPEVDRYTGRLKLLG